MRLASGLRLTDWRKTAAAAAPASTLLDGLVSYWSLDETSGTRADSVVASGFDLTDNNTVGSREGKNNKGASFVGTNEEYLSTTEEISYGANGEFHFAFWLYLPDLLGNEFLGGAWNPAKSFLVGALADAFTVWVRNAADSAEDSVSVTIPSAEVWHLCEAYHNPTTDKFGAAINGGAFTEKSWSGGVPASTTNFELGRFGASYTTASLDEVALWSRVLTSDERAELYNSGTGKFYNGTNFVEP